MGNFIKRVLVIVSLVAVLCFSTSCANSEKTQQKSSDSFNTHFYNPLRTEEMLGDPWVYKDGDTYYYTRSTGYDVVVSRSSTLSGLGHNALDTKQIFDAAVYAMTDIWAPEIFKYKDFWYVYFAADFGYNNDLHRMYTLKSKTSDPFGEWEFMGQLMLPDDQWAIDGTFFQANDGKIYTVWSGWKDITEGSNPGGTPKWKQNLYICELQDPCTVKEGATRVMISTPELMFETSVLPQNEGMSVVKSPNGTVYCLYAANYSGSDVYAIGVLQLQGDPLISENWTKFKEPLTKINMANGIYGPGHCSVVKSMDNKEDWIVFHSAKYSGAGWDRVTRMQKLSWVDDKPYVGTLENNNTPIELPSGEVVNRTIYYAAGQSLKQGATVIDFEGAACGKVVKAREDDAEINFSINAQQTKKYSLLLRYYTGLKTGVSVSFAMEGKPTGRAYLGATSNNFLSTGIMNIELTKGENIITLRLPKDFILDSLIIEN